MVSPNGPASARRRALLSAIGAACVCAPARSALAAAASASASASAADRTIADAATPIASDAHRDAGANTGAAPRIICLDWRLTELLVSLGVTPVGSANPDGFRAQFPASPLPRSVVDVGLIFQPNLELMRALAPSLILATPAHASLMASLERVATVRVIGSPGSGKPYADACADLRALGALLGRPTQAQRAIDATDAALDAWRDRIAASPRAAQRPVLVARIVDPLGCRLYGSTSLYGDVLARIGVRNAWHADVNGAGFATVSVDALADLQDAILAYFAPLPVTVSRAMSQSPLWRMLPVMRPGRQVALPSAPPNGGIASAAAFAASLSTALLALAADRPSDARGP
ncbi:ABC transporter substrate-binding protein [Pararobbsia silviterrae]|uniref:ABC transporter substrate-binding protein n=1 Tax=Pararobbsia silviterrae TaxID=1792498 RepID=UPI001314A652|nr:ABC transporter substrate-binding protein [Pararobbsia silviterrae]